MPLGHVDKTDQAVPKIPHVLLYPRGPFAIMICLCVFFPSPILKSRKNDDLVVMDNATPSVQSNISALIFFVSLLSPQIRDIGTSRNSKRWHAEYFLRSICRRQTTSI